MKGKLVPWEYREYGARVVEELFHNSIQIPRSHGKLGEHMLSPT